MVLNQEKKKKPEVKPNISLPSDLSYLSANPDKFNEDTSLCKLILIFRSVSGWFVTFFNALRVTHARAGMLSRERLAHVWIRLEIIFRPVSFLDPVID